MTASPTHTRPTLILGFAAFLAVSWTWCIGMFLPVLLVRDMGFGGWLIFAIPNVLGAAAMGWTLKTAQTSQDLVASHRSAAIAFSLVTIAFHIFFVAWLIPRLLGLWGAWLTFIGAGSLLVLTCTPARRDVAFAVAILIASTLAMLSCLKQGLRFDVPMTSPHAQLADLLSLLPVCIFGFALCPYLDLTFHRVRQYTTYWSARLAFSIGFGVFFLLMIVFSLLYARLLAPITVGPETNPLFQILAPVIGFHMAIQSAFTLAVHLRELTVFFHPSTRHRWSPVLGVTFMIPLALAVWTTTTPRLLGLNSGEVIYRCFMGFYGLVFPAYVYLCMIPFHSHLQAPRRPQVVVFAIAVVLAMPFFWLGFVGQRYFFLLHGIAIVLLARFAIPTPGSERSEDPDLPRSRAC